MSNRKMFAQIDLEDPEILGKHPENEAREAEVRGIAADRLRSIVERAENLISERKSLGDDLKDLMLEAKGNGFEPKAIRAIIKIRAQDADEVEQQESLLDVYRRALGMI